MGQIKSNHGSMGSYYGLNEVQSWVKQVRIMG